MNLRSSLYRHHRWSNLVLIDFLADLPAQDLLLMVPGTYSNSLDTIRHIVSSDADYVRIIPDAPRVTQISQDGPFVGWEELRSIADESGRALMRYVDDLTGDAYFIDIDEGTTFELSRSMLLNQIIHHATEHRSQFRTTLSAHGITPPELSTWAWRLSDDGQQLLAGLKSGQT
ncbi:MAG TPA: DinB family protein [Thermomicrobiales bacterium]|nr:DinB family protein [Thermomicrobiales bacterium]